MTQLERSLERLPLHARVAFAEICAQRAVADVRRFSREPAISDPRLDQALGAVRDFASMADRSATDQRASLYRAVRSLFDALPDGGDDAVLYAVHAVERALLATIDPERATSACATSGYDAMQVAAVLYEDQAAAQRREEEWQSAAIEALSTATASGSGPESVAWPAEYGRVGPVRPQLPG